MKGTRNFGWKVLAFVSCAALLAHVGARGFRYPFEYEEPDPVDSPVVSSPKDTLRFPISDHRNEPGTDQRNSGMDLGDPSNVNRSVEYDPTDNRYNTSEKIGNEFIRNPSFMTFDEYQKYSAEQERQNYWKRRLDALTMFNKKPDLPVMYKEGIFDRIFGGQSISVRPQGNVDVTVGGNWQNIQNPTLVQRAQKYGIFDFDMQMNINLLAQVGDKLKLNISNNTKATFDYQNVQKLEYTGKEDEIIKKIEAGNVSFPLRSSLIQGVQSLFGLKTQLQFGKLWVTAALSQQKSKRQSITVQGGAQTQTFAIKADDYEENKHFFLGQFFRQNYNAALKNFPIVASQATVNKIEIWVTNQTGAIDGVRDVLCFQDLGERNPYREGLVDPTKQAPPDNRVNSLYDRIQQKTTIRNTGNATKDATDIGRDIGLPQGLVQALDFSRTTARKLNASEFVFNPQLGYVSLNTQINPNDVLGVAYRYTYNGKVYQVGEFAEDLPPDTTNQKVMILKMLKTVNANTSYPIWDLMMKNVYLLGGMGVSKEDFRLNVLYQDPGGGEKRYLPTSAAAGIPLITLLNLDRLNFQNDPQPDGVFDYVEGITVLPQQGRIIFPVIEPFGSDLKPSLEGNTQDENKYLYQILYDSTKTIARQFQQKNRFIMRGTYRSTSSSEIFLGGFNIPQGSVTVTAGSQRLTENVDYQIDYGLGRLKIINTGILASGSAINVAYEDNATFGFQQQNFMGLHLDYYANTKLTVGGTIMRLTERPFTQKTSFGEDPIQNTVIGTDVAYQSELPGLTRILDKLPLYSTSAPSFINASAEVATLRPGHPKQINALDPEGSVYIDDFEGTRSAYDLKYPAAAWSLSSTPVGAKDRFGNILFPEATDATGLTAGFNRGRLAWYLIEPTLIDPVGGIPGYVKNDPNQHYIRLVQQQDVFPGRSLQTIQGALSTFDLTFIPNRRGPYNFDVNGTNADGSLSNPQRRWGGITRPLEYSDFEASNVEYIEFWLMDPFINKINPTGGSLYLNLGNISEDVLKDSRKFFENGIPYPKDQSKLDRTAWGNVPQFQQQITRAFDNDPAARATQDVGYDGLNNEEEVSFYAQYLADLANRVGAGSPAHQEAVADPSSDDYRYFRDNSFDQNTGFIRNRYLRFNNPQGNSPIADPNAQVSSASTIIPESEDIDRDNTLNESEDYYSYRIDLTPGALQVGSNFIVATHTAPSVKLPNGNSEPETWYQFKIPIREYQERVGNIADFRSIRFMRMYLTGFDDTVTTRFAQLNLGRNQWRRYMFSLKNPGENIPDDERIGTDFTVNSVSVEENGTRVPIPYVIPPGVNRQLQAVSSGQTIQQNEQALSLQVCGLKDGDARAAFKEVNVDMRQFGRLKMFVHGEAFSNQGVLRDGDVSAFIRVGSDFINNYYEYQIPLKLTTSANVTAEQIWPVENQVDLVMQDLVNAKTARNAAGGSPLVPWTVVDAFGHNIVVVGNPNIGESKTIMLGIVNPKKDARNPNDDGMAKCAEVWFNELRMTGLNEKPGYAATAKVNVQLADLGTVNAGGSMHTQGYGNIDQKLQQRQRDNYYQYDANTNLALGKLMPRSWGVQLPLFVGYSEAVSNPQYNPYDLDVTYKDQLRSANSPAQRDSLRKVAQDYTSITSVNLNNVRVTGNPEKQNAKTMPWSVKNFDLSYAYNRQFKRNPLIEGDELTNQRLGLGYAYSVRSKPIEPFKTLIKSRSKWLALIKDINLNPLPSTVSFRSDMNRVVDETKVRVIGDGVYTIPSVFYKNFIWTRTYALRWELTKSLSLDYSANNTSRIDEPYGKIDTKEKRDTLWKAIGNGGRNTLFTQQGNVAYNVPLAKLPATDWINLRVGYGMSYTWTAASRLAYTLGNTIGNTQSKTVNGELNFTQLYNKNRFLKAANAPRNRMQRKGTQPNARGGRDAGSESTNSLNPNAGGAPGQDPKAPEGKLEGAGPGGNQQTSTPTKPKKEERPKTLNLRGVVINTANMSDQQLDSVHKLIRLEEIEKAKAAKKKKKADRKAARKKRRATVPKLSPLERTAGQLLTMVKRATISYTESGATILPGYMDSTRFFGINPNGGYPATDFAFGGQPTTGYLDVLSANGRISSDSLFNAQFQQTHTSNLNLAMQVEPIPNDLRIDLTLTRQFSKNHSELYKDTSVGRTAGYTHNNPYETGSFNMTTIALKTMFDRGSGATTKVFEDFVRNRGIISGRLGNLNPYSGGVPNPGSDSFKKGYNRYSQDVLIPAFIAAYTGRSGNSAPLLDYENESIRSNPFRRYMPLPNWRLNYNGLSRIPAFRNIFNSFTLTNGYTGTLSMSSFSSALYYQDVYNLGFPSFLDSNSGNFVPYFQVPNITISEQFAPFVGIDASLKNNMTARFEYRRSRIASLSLIDYQISETKSAEFVFGGGYRVRGLKLPFSVFGVRKLDNDLNIKIDIGIRDDITTNTYLAQDLSIITRGQKVITISPSADYIINEKLTLRFFYDRRRSIPYTTQSYPMSTTRAGMTLRFIFAN